MALARGCVERGDIAQAVRYMTLLKGEPANISKVHNVVVFDNTGETGYNSVVKIISSAYVHCHLIFISRTGLKKHGFYLKHDKLVMHY